MWTYVSLEEDDMSHSVSRMPQPLLVSCSTNTLTGSMIYPMDITLLEPHGQETHVRLGKMNFPGNFCYWKVMSRKSLTLSTGRLTRCSVGGNVSPMIQNQ